VTHRPRKVHRRVGALLVMVATLVALLPASTVTAAGPAVPSTGGSSSGGEPPESGANVGSVPAVKWHGCGSGGGGLQCATYVLPLDYQHPSAGRVRVALNRAPASGPGRIGSLFINPGGPGGSGVDFVAAVASSPELKALRRHFDLVGFDPRGTNRSRPAIVCEPLARSVRRFDRALGHPGAARTVQDALREGRQFAASCQRRSGRLLPFMGTEYAARDLDQLRAAVGDTRLSYLGLSYGTYLGAVYADLFPARVRAVAVDGSLDPFAYGDDYLGLLGLNYRASERSVDAFLAWCSSHAAQCRFGDGAAAAALDTLVAQLDKQPITKGTGADRVTTNGYTVLYLLYLLTGSGRDAWPQTGELLAKIAAGSPVVTNRDLLAPAGGATNIVIECTDAAGSLDPTDFVRFARRSAALAPRLGPALAYGPPSYDGANAAACSSWPVRNPPSDWRGDFRAQGADPVLVVGSVGDPSTPYPGAVALAATLDSARLLTESGGPGATHTSFFYNSCIRAKVATYLTRLTLPAAGTRCPEERSRSSASEMRLLERLGS
jgi:pimeloyl-ACP methyl ester carboxylesterase